MSLAAGESCPDPGMVPIGFLTSQIPTSPASKFTTLKMGLSMFISHGSLAAQRSFLPPFTGMVTRGGDRDGHQNGWIAYCGLDLRTPPARVTSSRHGAQHAAIGDPPQRQDDLLQQSQHQDGCAPQVHSSPEDTPGTAQEDQPFRECTYSEDPGPGEVTLLSETEWTTDDEDTEDPAASGLMDETMEQKRTTDSGAGQDLGDIHEGTLGAGSRTTAKYGRKYWPDLQQGAMKISPQVEQTRDRAQVDRRLPFVRSSRQGYVCIFP